MADLERIYVVPFRAVYNSPPRNKRSRKAVKILRSFISRHMKAEEANISISEGVNSLIWKRGIQKPPRKIKVKAVKSGDRVVVSLLDEKVEEKKLETPKPKKEEAPKTEEKKEAKVEGAGAAPVKEEPKPEAKPPEPKAEEKKEPEKPAEIPKEEAKPEVKAEAPEKKE